MGFEAELRGPKRASRALPKSRIAVDFDACAEGSGVGGGEGEAGVDGCFRVGGGFGGDQLAGEGDQARLLAAGTGEQSAHGNLRVGRRRHGRFFSDRTAETL